MRYQAVVLECDAEGCGEYLVIKIGGMKPSGWLMVEGSVFSDQPGPCICPYHVKLKKAVSVDEGE